MGIHNILSKTDRAVTAWLIEIGAGTEEDVYPAKRADGKALPNTVCHSSVARQDPPNSGVYIVTTSIQVRTDPSVDVNQTPGEKKDASEERVSNTFDALMQQVGTGSGQLAAAITTAARAAGVEDFTVQAVVVIRQEAGFDGRGNAWTDALDLELVVCPSNV